MQLPPLESGILIRRYKRFLADVQLDSGEQITAFTPNTGSMQGCSEPGSPVRLSKSGNPSRKYPYTLELVKSGSVWVGVHTGRPNHLVREAVENGVIPELRGYDQVRQEVRYGVGSRIDLLLSTDSQLCYVEVKNVTLVQHSTAFFPDALTSRGTKHLNELIEQVRAGHRAVMVYTVQRADARSFAPAAHIDPVYARTFYKALDIGVEMLIIRAKITETSIKLNKPLYLNPTGKYEQNV